MTDRPPSPPAAPDEAPGGEGGRAAGASPGPSILWPILAVPPAAIAIYVIGLARGMQTAPGDNDFLVGNATGIALIAVLTLGLVALFVRRLRRPSALIAALAFAAMLAVSALFP